MSPFISFPIPEDTGIKTIINIHHITHVEFNCWETTIVHVVGGSIVINVNVKEVSEIIQNWFKGRHHNPLR